MKSMKEIWIPIKDYEDQYMISNLGRIKSLKRKGRKNNIILKEGVDKCGYLFVSLTKNGISHTFYNHRLVALHFILNNENKLEVNHIDGNKKNNYFYNLEWVTHLENINHAIQMNLINTKNRKGENSRNVKLTIKQVQEIRELLKTNTTLKKIGEKYNVTKHAIFRIKTNKTWRE